MCETLFAILFLQSRALDPLNASNMKDIRNLHLYLDKTLRYVITCRTHTSVHFSNEGTVTVTQPELTKYTCTWRGLRYTL